MFYPEKIKSIKTSDKVLEIGPGASPFQRSDVFLEIALDSQEEYEAQFGHGDKLKTDKPVIFYDGKKFPFKDKEFDYVICSHVIEHVPDVELFVAEMFRVAPAGYLEYPLAPYDYLFNFDVHLNFLKFENNVLTYKKKSATSLNEFKPLQQFFFRLMQQGHFTTMLNDLPEYFFEGFEWKNNFQLKITDELKEVCGYDENVPPYTEPDLTKQGAKKLSKELLKSIISKVKR